MENDERAALFGAKKFTLRLGAETVSDLDWIAVQQGGVTVTEVLRRAIALQKFLLERRADGEIIVLEDKVTKRQRELALL